MKLDQTPKKYTLISAIIIAIFGAISALAIWQLTDRDELVNDPETLPKTTERVTQKEPTPETIILPNATPIPKIAGNYTSDDHLWRLVNKTHPLSDTSYRPSDLVVAHDLAQADKSTEEQSVRSVIYDQLVALFSAAHTQGIELKIGSGFRSAESQQMYYSNYVKTYGQAAADTFSAKPGHSEHQTGLAVDLTTADQYCRLERCFGDTAAGKWLAANTPAYGFILRYPDGKEAVTGYTYEPWHFRYVGPEFAKALVESGLTLDEASEHLTSS